MYAFILDGFRGVRALLVGTRLLQWLLRRTQTTSLAYASAVFVLSGKLVLAHLEHTKFLSGTRGGGALSCCVSSVCSLIVTPCAVEIAQAFCRGTLREEIKSA